jgi:hypothetical protein
VGPGLRRDDVEKGRALSAISTITPTHVAVCAGLHEGDSSSDYHRDDGNAGL